MNSIKHLTTVLSVFGLGFLVIYFDLFINNRCMIIDDSRGRVFPNRFRLKTWTKNKTIVSSEEIVETIEAENGTIGLVERIRTAKGNSNIIKSSHANSIQIAFQNVGKETETDGNEYFTTLTPTLVPKRGKGNSKVKQLVLTLNGRLAKFSTNEYYVMTMLSVFNGKAWPGYENYTLEDLDQRDNEYLRTLEHNINHKLVKEVYLFYVDDKALKLVKSRRYRNEHKIVPLKRDRALHMADFFLYASRNLVDKPVIALNGDIILGEGFDLVDTERLRDEKVLFSVSRYNTVIPGKCLKGNMALPEEYQVSHDTHIFRLAEPLNETILLDKLDYPINMWGAENAMIWTFKYILKWAVRNPAKFLKTYHYHCSRVHGPSKENIDTNNYSIMYLANKGWRYDHVLASFVLYDNKIEYGYD